MATIRTGRSCRLCGNVLTITDPLAKQVVTRYHVEQLEHACEIYGVTKLDDAGEPVERYNVSVEPGFEGCDCPAGCWRPNEPCRHYAAIAALRERGRL